MSGAQWWQQFATPLAGARPAAPAAPPAAPVPSTAAPAAAPPVVRAAARPARRPRAPRGLRALQALSAVLGLLLLVQLALLGLRAAGATEVLLGAPAGAGAPAAVGAAVGPAPAVGAERGGGARAQGAALAELQRLREQGLAGHAPRGQWAAQLAAKSVGTTDAGQRAANGSSTFYAADILAQSRQLASGLAGPDVFVLASTDFGERAVDARGNPFWTTFAAGPFADAGDVRAWCDSVFAAVPAGERANACFPRQLTAP
ncbi:hypothetical protein [Kineococcus gypseus]|uniref:hypothetical protein n=1 Tax=Kineococcus gypseus TaxID=1637102 RepID=UPI003D7D1BA9